MNYPLQAEFLSWGNQRKKATITGSADSENS